MSEKVTVSEKDKPFILAIGSLILFAGEIAAAVSLKIINVPTPDILSQATAFTMGLVSTAWTYYLVKKNGITKKE